MSLGEISIQELHPLLSQTPPLQPDADFDAIVRHRSRPRRHASYSTYSTTLTVHNEWSRGCKFSYSDLEEDTYLFQLYDKEPDRTPDFLQLCHCLNHGEDVSCDHYMFTLFYLQTALGQDFQLCRLVFRFIGFDFDKDQWLINRAKEHIRKQKQKYLKVKLALNSVEFGAFFLSLLFWLCNSNLPFWFGLIVFIVCALAVVGALIRCFLLVYLWTRETTLFSGSVFRSVRATLKRLYVETIESLIYSGFTEEMNRTFHRRKDWRIFSERGIFLHMFYFRNIFLWYLFETCYFLTNALALSYVLGLNSQHITDPGILEKALFPLQAFLLICGVGHIMFSGLFYYDQSPKLTRRGRLIEQIGIANILCHLDNFISLVYLSTIVAFMALSKEKDSSWLENNFFGHTILFIIFILGFLIFSILKRFVTVYCVDLNIDPPAHLFNAATVTSFCTFLIVFALTGANCFWSVIPGIITLLCFRAECFIWPTNTLYSLFYFLSFLISSRR